jgi:hypothetical protein
VKVPEAPAITVTVAPVELPLNAPLPVIVQEWVTNPPVGETVHVYTFVVNPQTGLFPVMLQDGIGLTLTVLVHALREGQPSRVTLSVRVKFPDAPASTLTEELVKLPLIVPLPEIDQL